MKLETGKKYKVVKDVNLPSIALWEYQTGKKSDKSAVEWFMQGFDELGELTIEGYTLEITRLNDDGGSWFKLFDENGIEVKNTLIPESEEFWLPNFELEISIEEI